MKKVFVKPEVRYLSMGPVAILAESGSDVTVVDRVGDGDNLKLDAENTIKYSKDIW